MKREKSVKIIIILTLLFWIISVYVYFNSSSLVNDISTSIEMGITNLNEQENAIKELHNLKLSIKILQIAFFILPIIFFGTLIYNRYKQIQESKFHDSLSTNIFNDKLEEN